MRFPEKFRMWKGAIDSRPGDPFGVFLLPPKIGARRIIVVATDGRGWEHVSVSIRDGGKARTPIWEEMAAVKSVFWEPEEAVMQLHPPESHYVNNHPNVLHLWRPSNPETPIPLPPDWMVGVKELGDMSGMSQKVFRQAQEDLARDVQENTAFFK